MGINFSLFMFIEWRNSFATTPNNLIQYTWKAASLSLTQTTQVCLHVAMPSNKQNDVSIWAFVGYNWHLLADLVLSCQVITWPLYMITVNFCFVFKKWPKTIKKMKAKWTSIFRKRKEHQKCQEKKTLLKWANLISRCICHC